MKQSKRLHFTNHFKNIIKDMKNAWNGNNAIIFLKAKESEFPKSVFKNKSDDLTNPIDIVGSFNNFFFCCNKHPI